MRGERKIVTTSRVVWTLPNPCYWADVEAVFAVIRNSANGPELRFDDSVVVHGMDDTIEISFATPNPDVSSWVAPSGSGGDTVVTGRST